MLVDLRYCHTVKGTEYLEYTLLGSKEIKESLIIVLYLPIILRKKLIYSINIFMYTKRNELNVKSRVNEDYHKQLL